MSETLPHNLPAEMSVLGAVLYDNRAWRIVSDRLTVDDFYTPANCELWMAMGMLLNNGRAADHVTLQERMQMDDMRGVGGPKYLLNLLDVAAIGPELRDYAAMLSELTARRRVMVTADIAKSAAASGKEPVAKVVDDTQGALQSIVSNVAAGTIVSLRDAIEVSLDAMSTHLQAGTTPGMQSGLERFDDFTGGLHRSDLVILAGRPSMGKTGVGVNLITAAAREGKKAGIFSHEMTAEQLSMRAIASQARRTGVGFFEYQKMRRLEVRSDELDKLKTLNAGTVSNIVLDATPNLTARDIRVRAREMKRMLGGLDVLLIDYLGLINLEQGQRENKADAIERVTKYLKETAKTLNCCVILLCQLSRQVEQREDKRPMLSDLRDSGAIEQDADTVIFVYREDYYLERQSDPAKPNPDLDARLLSARGKVQLIFAKHRMGPIGTITLGYELETDCLTNSPGEFAKTYAQGSLYD